jgi:hypothetical protein
MPEHGGQHAPDRQILGIDGLDAAGSRKNSSQTSRAP